MTVELKWVPSMEASDHRARGWREVMLHGGIADSDNQHFLMVPPVREEEPAKAECPNCLQQVPGELEHWHSGYHDDYCTVEPHYVCEQQISELDDRHNRMASPEYQAKVKADMAEARAALALVRWRRKDEAS